MTHYSQSQVHLVEIQGKKILVVSQELARADVIWFGAAREILLTRRLACVRMKPTQRWKKLDSSCESLYQAVPKAILSLNFSVSWTNKCRFCPANLACLSPANKMNPDPYSRESYWKLVGWNIQRAWAEKWAYCLDKGLVTKVDINWQFFLWPSPKDYHLPRHDRSPTCSLPSGPLPTAPRNSEEAQAESSSTPSQLSF